MNTGLLLLHVFFGLALVAHAGQKLFVFRISGLSAYLAGFGLRPARPLALAAIATELVGGGLVAAGALIPVGAALVGTTMVVAARTDHRGKGWFITGPGAEYVVTNLVIAVTLAATGGGRYALDSALGWSLHGPVWAAAVAAVSLAGAATVLAVFRAPSPEPAPAA